MTKIPCPVCRENGRDRTGDNMTVYDDGHGYCHHPECHAWLSKEKLMGTETTKESTLTTSLTAEDIETYPFGYDTSRNIHEATAKKFKIKVSHDEMTGDIDKIFYPYTYNKEVSYKIRHIPKKGFAWAGPYKGKGLFGQEHCRGFGRLFVTEGEEDCMAVYDMLQQAPASKAEVVSLPNGAALDKAVMEHLDWFSGYKSVYLCLDSDAPGMEAAEKIASWLSANTTVFVVDQGELKDASEWRKHGDHTVWKSLVKATEAFQPEGIVNGIDIPLESLLHPLVEGYRVPFPGLQKRIHGVRKGEIMTVCAGSGIGKSTLVRELTLSLIEQGLSVANIALEDQMTVTAQSLMALDMDIPVSHFRFNPPSEEEARPSYNKVIANGLTYFYKHFAGIDADSLMEKMYYYAKAKACDILVLDHLSLVISATATSNERKDIDTLMTKLAKLVVETGVGLIQVVHLRRPTGDKSYARGAEVELTDLRGSASLEQLSWCVLGMERDQQGDDSDFSCIRVLKNRTFGFTGIADRIKYYPETGRMKSVESEKPDLPESDPMSDAISSKILEKLDS